MQIIPTQPVASQTLNIVLGGQTCTINLYSKTALFDNTLPPELWAEQTGNAPEAVSWPLAYLTANGQDLLTQAGIPISTGDASGPAPNTTSGQTIIFCDLYVLNVPIVTGVIMWHANRMVRDAYLGFIGDLVIFDVTGAGQSPNFAGLNSQFQLVYMTPTDLAALGFVA